MLSACEPYLRAIQDIDPGRQEGKERRTPAKKNRIHLDTTVEEEDVVSGSRTPSHSPPLGTSPPHEMKIRQISQGVEDLTWQNGMKKIIAEEDAPLDANLATDADAEETEVVADVTPEETKDTPDSGPEALMSAADEGVADNTKEVSDEPTAPAPPSLLPDEEVEVGEKEKGVKRKYGARITSGDILRTSQITEPLKRPRDDDEDKDDNHRETKRPSPPPEPTTKPVDSPPPTPKLVGYLSILVVLILIALAEWIYGVFNFKLAVCNGQRSAYIFGDQQDLACGPFTFIQHFSFCWIALWRCETILVGHQGVHNVGVPSEAFWI